MLLRGVHVMLLCGLHIAKQWRGWGVLQLQPGMHLCSRALSIRGDNHGTLYATKPLARRVLFACHAGPDHCPANRVKAAKTKKQEKQDTSQYGVAGRDPKAFPDAEAMFARPGQTILDDPAARAVLADLQLSLPGGDLGSPQLWVQLDHLRGVTMSGQMMEAVRDTGQKMALAAVPLRGLKFLPGAFTGIIAIISAFVAIIVFGIQFARRRRPVAGIILLAGIAIVALNFYVTRRTAAQIAAAKQPFEQGNGYYQAGRFDKAVDSYRLALKEYPAFWDAWNNLALAEMHRNNDLLALFLLSALTRNNPQYAGGSINFSVCLERLGQDAAAYNIAAALATAQPQNPMALYNLAWFDNSRGRSGPASADLSKTLGEVVDYPLAKIVQTINSMEADHSITADQLKALPRSHPSPGIPRIVSKPVVLANAEAYSGKAVVAKIPKGSQLVISERVGDWYAFYWPVGNVKRRLWIHQSGLGSQALVAQNDTKPPSIHQASLGSQTSVAHNHTDPSSVQQASPGSQTPVPNNGIDPFLGTWTAKWGDVTDILTIAEVDGKPKVTEEGWRVWDEKIENGVLSFREKGGSSDWEFVYTLTSKPGKIALEVFRVDDQERFSGELTK